LHEKKGLLDGGKGGKDEKVATIFVRSRGDARHRGVVGDSTRQRSSGA